MHLRKKRSQSNVLLKAESASLSYGFKGEIPENSTCQWNATVYREDCPNNTYGYNTISKGQKKKPS